MRNRRRKKSGGANREAPSGDQNSTRIVKSIPVLFLNARTPLLPELSAPLTGLSVNARQTVSK